MTVLKTWVAAAAIVAPMGAAHAAAIFEGRLADGTASTTCTVSGATKCAMFYNPTLDITILNDWNIGLGFWSDTAAVGSAQALAESAGAEQTSFTGWFLPTGQPSQSPGPLNQYLYIWYAVGGSLLGLQGQFDGVQLTYWSSSEYAQFPELAWVFGTGGVQTWANKSSSFYAVAVRPGDVAASVPEDVVFANGFE